MRLFTYGTLRRRGRLEALTGRRLPDPQPATLEGFRKQDTGYGYPVILPDPDGQVEGLVWEIEPGDLAELDHYEGSDEVPPLYLRQAVSVRIGGEQVPAWVYVGNPQLDWPPPAPGEAEHARRHDPHAQCRVGAGGFR